MPARGGPGAAGDLPPPSTRQFTAISGSVDPEGRACRGRARQEHRLEGRGEKGGDEQSAAGARRRGRPVRPAVLRRCLPSAREERHGEVRQHQDEDHARRNPEGIDDTGRDGNGRAEAQEQERWRRRRGPARAQLIRGGAGKEAVPAAGHAAASPARPVSRFDAQRSSSGAAQLPSTMDAATPSPVVP